MSAPSDRPAESVWDYPRPPRLERASRLVRIEFGGREIVRSPDAFRVLETSHPPVYYVPPADVEAGVLQPSRRRSICEWKGQAHYWSLRIGERYAEDAAWSYPRPTAAFAAMRDYLAFYPGRVDGCYLDGERVRAQAGDFYGGWITAEIVGPFKGERGTAGW